ncbi:MAG: hypothetical protein K9I71_07345 [Ignavibacteriales bacterium]|nr:hypothetical protein [Ignavibacteriales bacterium]MCF8315922.1 hypothetical protein [Ignavibacteriales bacterium]MCF8437516.1 hypothetical protein [Ignavibacteriales bacterium]
MEEKNYRNYPVYLFATIIALLYVISFLPKEQQIFGVHLRHVDILSDLKQPAEEAQKETIDPYEYKGEDFWKKDNSGNITGMSPVYASIGGFDFIQALISAASNSAPVADPQFKNQELNGNTDQMSYFYNNLKNAAKKPVRIAHFGDSIIGGDLITMDIRDNLQKEFGGQSPGVLAITSQDIKFRMTTEHSFASDKWQTVDINRNPKKLPMVANGSVAIPKGGSWVEYAVTPHYKNLNAYKTVKIYYTDAKASSINYSFDGAPAKSVALNTNAGVQELVLNAPKPAKKVRIEFPVEGQANVFCVSLENGGGVIVDNFSFQGQTGENLTRLPLDLLQQFNGYMDYSLVILQFGLNVIDKIEKDPAGYDKNMVEVVKYLKQAFPKASFVMMGVNDKGFKKGANIVSDPSVLKLLAVQQSIAKNADIAFWNLFEAMGGMNSMESWVKANPPLASSDYTHFNDQGARKVADLFSAALIDGYKEAKNKR